MLLITCGQKVLKRPQLACCKKVLIFARKRRTFQYPGIHAPKRSDLLPVNVLNQPCKRRINTPHKADNAL